MCFVGIIYLTSQCIYLPKFLHSNHNLNNEKSKDTRALDVTLPSTNLGTHRKDLRTLTSTPKKPKRNNGDMKQKLKLDKVFYKNIAYTTTHLEFCDWFEK